MMKRLLMHLLLLQPLLCLAQHKKEKPRPAAPANAVTPGPQTEYTTAERRHFYPFKQASQIKLVFFERTPVTRTIRLKGRPDYNYVAYKYALPRVNDTICLSCMAQMATLSADQTDSLTDLLYNTCYRSPPTPTERAACFLPHNAILFFDGNSQPFAYIELCFDCRQIAYSNGQVAPLADCDETLYRLKAYFVSLGLGVKGEEMKDR